MTEKSLPTLLDLRSSNIKTCANPECNKQFSPNTHNQKYCTEECCRVVTNKRIMKDYYEQKEIRDGKYRVCDNGCGTVLSRYNPTSVCAVCDRKKVEQGKALLDVLV